MSALEALVLGVVQGLTEFLPISSTAHLRVVPALLGWPDPGVAFSAVIQLGSVLAVLTYFWKDLVEIVSGSLRAYRRADLGHRDARLMGAIIVGTVPICLIGLLLKPVLEDAHGPLRSLSVIGVASLCMGLLLLLSERLCRHRRGIDEMGARDGLIVGLGQALALIPGCSRSGSTLTAALLMDMRRDDAARFSFLLGIPAILLAGVIELKAMIEKGLNGSQTTDLAIGLLASTVVSYLSIAWLIKYLRNHSTWLFIAYRMVFGLSVLYLAGTGVIR